MANQRRPFQGSVPLPYVEGAAREVGVVNGTDVFESLDLEAAAWNRSSKLITFTVYHVINALASVYLNLSWFNFFLSFSYQFILNYIHLFQFESQVRLSISHHLDQCV